MHLRSRVFDTLFLHAPNMQQIPTKIDTKLSNGTFCTQNTIKRIYNKNWGYSTIINKQKIDKCHKTYIQNNYILALINSPQLDTLFVLKQSQVNLKKQKTIIKESRINKFLKRKTNVWFKRKRTRRIQTYHYTTTTTYKRNKS